MHVTTVTAVTAKLKVQNIVTAVTAVTQNQSAYTGAPPKKLPTASWEFLSFQGLG